MSSVTLALLLIACGTRWDAVDADGDGFSRQDGDCWDAIEGPVAGMSGADIYPGADDVPYDGVDQDCMGDDDYDQDEDGFVQDEHVGLVTLGVPGSGELPGGDCWDDPADIPEGFSVITGHDAAGAPLTWDQPTADQVQPDAEDTWYDGVDQDCGGDDDLDQDGDGYRNMAYPDREGAFGEDCVDGSALDDPNPAGLSPGAINPGAQETWYDGTDADCDGWSDYDADLDHYDCHLYGGEDCDDQDPQVNPEGVEVWYDGVDQDCDGNDGDQDGDLYWIADYEDLVLQAGGEPMDIPAGFEGDCDDQDPAISPAAEELWDGVDNDCSGVADDMLVDDVALSRLSGPTPGALGWPSGLAIGDLNGDGLMDLVVGDSTYQDYQGAVWLVSLEDHLSLSGEIGDLAHGALLGAAPENSLAGLAPHMGDVTGNEVADLLITGMEGISATEGNYAAVLFEGSESLTGDLTPDLAALRFSDSPQAGMLVGLNHTDMNGDGLAEILLGAPDSGAGEVYLFHPAGVGHILSITADHDALWQGSPDGRAGTVLGGADLDMDGHDDLFVASPGDSTGGDEAGMLHIIPGATILESGALEDLASVSIRGGGAGHRLGDGSSAVLSDLDGDGRLDLLVAAPGASTVYIFLEADGLAGLVSVSEADVVLEGPPGSWLGWAMSTGDLTGDGSDDLALGAPGNAGSTTPSESNPGSLFLLPGAAIHTGIMDVTRHASVLQPSAPSMLGFGVILADLDDDGVAEAIALAPARDGAGTIWFIPSPW